ncbi:MAG TPA: hypothetical protein VGM64_10280 [Lacunisphaera sp.]|jgi:hypothetical protein
MLKAIKFLLWTYLVLLIFEGALRKWVLPGAADALLIIRDPVVILIYVLAIFERVFPINGFVIAIGALTAASVAASFIAGQHNLIVMCYGLRINYLHLPLIWVMAEVLDVRDVRRYGIFILLVAIPMAFVMVEQFRSPINARINQGVGGTEGGQIFGADGKIRPPGFFAFITGPQLFLPLAAAFFFYQASVKRQLPWLILLGAGISIAISLPVSISRTAVLATVLVGGTFAFTLLFGSKRAGAILRTGLIMGVLLAGLSFLPIFSEGRDAFLSRWQTAATSNEGDAVQNISDRVLGGFFQPFVMMKNAPFFGAGIGVGSNVGARLLSGKVGFLLAEDEWSKIFLELGPVLGLAFIGFRVVLTCYLGFVALRALVFRREALPILLFAAAGVAVFEYQWGPPTILGFAVLGAGMILAALKPAPVEGAMTETPGNRPEFTPLPPTVPPTTTHRPPVLSKLPA